MNTIISSIPLRRGKLTLLLVPLFILSACASQPPSKVENLALYQTATASVFFVSASPWLSVDGETGAGWSPQAPLPQWFQVDLGSAATVNEIRLLVNQPVSGRSVHAIWVGGTSGDLTEVHRFDQVNRTGDWLVFTPATPLRGIRYVHIESLEGTEWVGWLEVQVLGVK